LSKNHQFTNNSEYFHRFLDYSFSRVILRLIGGKNGNNDRKNDNKKNRLEQQLIDLSHRNLDFDYALEILWRFSLLRGAAFEVSYHLLVNLTVNAIAPTTISSLMS
jgi:hypothetical protein